MASWWTVVPGMCHVSYLVFHRSHIAMLPPIHRCGEITQQGLLEDGCLLGSQALKASHQFPEFCIGLQERVNTSFLQMERGLTRNQRGRSVFGNPPHTHQITKGIHLQAKAMLPLQIVLIVQADHLHVVLPHCSLLSFFVLEEIRCVVFLIQAQP